MALFFREAFRRKEEEEAELVSFRDEIERAVELDKQNQASGHFKDIKKFNKTELTLRDMYIWRKVKDGSVTEEEFRSYRKACESTKLSSSRDAFVQWVSNLANIPLARKRLQELARDREQKT